MKKFSPFVRNLAFRMSNGYCMCSDRCIEKATEIHHLMANSLVNQRLYPLFLQSIFNACPINNDCHMTKPLPKIKEKIAKVYEEYLEGLKNGNS